MSLFLAMTAFALVMSASPGPVNIITLTSGATRGVTKTLPFISGATLGFTALLLILGLGAVQAVTHFPKTMNALGVLGALFILYMAYKLARAAGDLSEKDREAPRFIEGALLQWLNPKAWIACLSGITAFTTQNDFSSLVIFCLLYFFVCYAGISIWAVIGAHAKPFLNSPVRLQTFNRDRKSVV